MDGEVAAEIRHLAGSLTWAVERAGGMHAVPSEGGLTDGPIGRAITGRGVA